MATVDVRLIIAAGGEPSGAIRAAVATLAEHEELVVLAPFEPVPREGVLGSQGFSCGAAGPPGDSGRRSPRRWATSRRWRCASCGTRRGARR